MNKQIEISKFTYGTRSIGRPLSDIDNDIRLIEMAVEEGVWIHTSRTFQEGRTFEILKKAIEKIKPKELHLILRVRADNAEILKHDIEEALKCFSIAKIDIVQLYTEDEDKMHLIDDFVGNGEVKSMCDKLIVEGKIGKLGLEVFSAFAEYGLEALRNKLFDYYIFYYNLLERQVNNELFDLIESSDDVSIIALRPLGDVFKDPNISNQRNDFYNTHAVTYDQDAIKEVLDKSDCKSLLELSIRFLLSQPKIKSIVGGTSSIRHLDDFISYTAQVEPLEPKIISEIKSLHRKWYK